MFSSWGTWVLLGPKYVPFPLENHQSQDQGTKTKRNMVLKQVTSGCSRENYWKVNSLQITSGSTKKMAKSYGTVSASLGRGTGKDIIRSSSLSSMICTVRLERHPNTSELVDWTGRSLHLQVNQYEISSWSMTIHT